MSSGDLIPRIYSNFRGVDFRGDEINLTRSPDALNMWKDYKKTESISTRPAMDTLWSSETETVWGLYFFNGKLIIHIGTRLVERTITDNPNDSERRELGVTVANGKSEAFIFNNNWFFKDGTNYLQYDGTNKKDDSGNELKDEKGNPIPNINEVEGYVPTTYINRRVSKDGIPGSGGETYQDVNLLSLYRWNTFTWDGDKDAIECHLDSPDAVEVSEFKLLKDGAWIDVAKTLYQLDTTSGIVKLLGISLDSTNIPSGVECIKIKFKVKDADKLRDKINKCTLLQVFDNRVFFSGNPDFPNMLWHSSLNDPTYCSDLDYYNEGLDTAAVKGMVAGNDALWVFKEPSQANTTAFYHRPISDAEYGKIYPNSHSSISTGCVGKAINFNDDIVFFSDRGMEGVSQDITTEQFLAHRSSLVDRKLIAEPDYANMILEEWEGYLLVIIGNKIYLADSRAMFQNVDHNEYEWFYWKMPYEITCAKVNKGVLWLGSNNGLHRITDGTNDVVIEVDSKGKYQPIDKDIESYWVTPKDKFNHPQYLKTTNKRGCTVEATGRISVYAKTEKNEGFTEDTFVGIYPDAADENAVVEDAFVSRIKRKKFKDIQLKFASDKPFRLETVTLECFIGGYIKR